MRGLSYGASSSLNHDRQRELWSMWTFPAAKDARQCVELQLRLYDDWVKNGVKPGELTRAKNFLIKSHAFEIDTAQKRLDSSAVESAVRVTCRPIPPAREAEVTDSPTPRCASARRDAIRRSSWSPPHATSCSAAQAAAGARAARVPFDRAPSA